MFHDPVMPQETLEYVMTPEMGFIFDGTLGLGGHALNCFQNRLNLQKYIATDLDQQHLTYAADRLSEYQDKLALYNSNFSDLADHIPSQRTAPLALLLDLGICSNHVDDAQKGFAHSQNGPLHMAFDTETSDNAEQFLHQADEAKLKQVFYEFGEEKSAPRIARAIIERRQNGKMHTTDDLRIAIESSVHPKDRSKALTRVFQAIRMQVNQELPHLEKTLKTALNIMQPEDRLGVITYHSLEDRLVKDTFKRWSKPVTAPGKYSNHEIIEPAQGELVSKKPILPSSEEIKKNPRARSAKYRIFIKK